MFAIEHSLCVCRLMPMMLVVVIIIMIIGRTANGRQTKIETVIFLESFLLYTPYHIELGLYYHAYEYYY